MTDLMSERKGPSASLTLTARLNTAALDSRRGVVRLHPEAVAALGIREWDAVSLMGSRTTAAVVGIAPARDPDGDRPAGRRDTVQRGTARGRHRRGVAGHRLRRQVGDPERV